MFRALLPAFETLVAKTTASNRTTKEHLEGLFGSDIPDENAICDRDKGPGNPQPIGLATLHSFGTMVAITAFTTTI